MPKLAILFDNVINYYNFYFLPCTLIRLYQLRCFLYGEFLNED